MVPNHINEPGNLEREREKDVTKTLKDVNETIELKETYIWHYVPWHISLKYNQAVFIFFHGDGLKSASSFTKSRAIEDKRISVMVPWHSFKGA